MKLIGITGFKYSGKDTLGSALSRNHGYMVLKFADPLKVMMRSLLRSAGLSPDEIEAHIEGDKKEVPLPCLQNRSCRFAMQKLGTEWRDFFGQDLWTSILDAKIKKFSSQGFSKFVITDCRFLHEAEFIHSLGGKIVRVYRQNQQISSDLHPSELEIIRLPIDYHFQNLEDNFTAVDAFAEKLASL